MKRLVQSTSSLAAILALIAAAMWLVWSISGQQGPTAQATPSSQEPIQWTIVSPEATPVAQVTVASTVKPQYTPKPTSLSRSEIDFDTVKVVGIEEVTTPVAFGLTWSPDRQKAMLMRQFTHKHILARSSTESYAPLNTLDLWVWQEQTGQEIKVTDRAMAWDWAPDSQAIVYVTPLGDEGLSGELRLFDLETQTHQKIVDTDLAQAYPGPFWLSSGDIIYMDEARLWMMQPDGSNRRLLNNLQIYRDEAAQASRSEYAHAPDKLAGRMYISPDETRMAYETASSPELEFGYQVRVADLTGDNRINTENFTSFTAWSSDGTFFVYQKAISYEGRFYFRNLWLADRNGLDARRLLDVVEWGQEIDYNVSEVKERPGDIGFVALSPDNRLIVLSEFSENSLWLLDMTSARLRLLYQDPHLTPLTSLEWSANNELIVSIASGTSGVDNTYLRLLLGG